MAYSLSGEQPRAAALPSRFALAVAAAVTNLTAARRRRKALATLTELDDYQLWDLGIARGDLNHVIRSEAFDIDLVRDWRRTLDVWPPR